MILKKGDRVRVYGGIWGGPARWGTFPLKKPSKGTVIGKCSIGHPNAVNVQFDDKNLGLQCVDIGGCVKLRKIKIKKCPWCDRVLRKR